MHTKHHILGTIKDSTSKDTVHIPVLIVENRDPSKWMKPVDRKPNTFITVNTGRPHDLEIRPFYSIYDRKYSVYLDLSDEKDRKPK